MAEMLPVAASFNFIVIPAKAGIPLVFDALRNSGTPAFAGATILEDRRG